MAIVIDPDLQEQVVLLEVSWETYEMLAAGIGAESHARLAYNGATLELMSPLTDHEACTRFLDALLTSVMFEWNVNLYNTGSSTLRTKPLGAEPDSSFYIEHAALVDGLREIDLRLNPPPDLVVEVDMSNRRLDKLVLYATLGVPEFWRYDRQGLHGFSLVGGHYASIDVSVVIRGLPLGEIAKRLARRLEADRATVLREWHEWLSAHLHLRNAVR